MYFSFEINVITWIQETLPSLIPLMYFFTTMGLSTPYMVIICLIYWCYNPHLGARLGIFLIGTSTLNEFLKQFFQAPRPYWVSTQIAGLDGSHGFGMPSGHAQASTFWLLLGSALRNRWIWIVAVTMTVGIGVSRFALGAHFPNQVLAGWLIGLFNIWLLYRYEKPLCDWYNKFSVNQQMFIASGICALVLCIGIVIVALSSTPSALAQWQINAQFYISGNSKLHSVSYYGIVAMTGSLYGALIGLTTASRLGLNHDIQSILWPQKLARAALGLGILIASKALLGSVPISASGFIGYGWLFLESTLLTILVFLVIPWIFKLSVDKIKTKKPSSPNLS